MEEEIKILNEKEKEIKQRLFSIAFMESHDNYFYRLFKNEINFTEEQKDIMDGFYHLAGRGMFGKIIDDRLANTCIKWILTGEKKYYEIIKDWFIWHLKNRIIENKKEIENDTKIKKIENKQEGYIYIIKSKNLYKIGRTKNLKNRFKTYRTENPFEIKVIFQKKVNDYIKEEIKLLTKFKDKNYKGEWFKLDKKDIQWIKENL
jgi:thymidine phosphorylase